MTSSQDPILGLDASCYAIRAAVCQGKTELLDTLEARPEETPRVARFLQDHARRFPDLKIVACPLDPWPPGLEQALRQERMRVDWLSPRLMRNVFSTLTHYNQKRRLHRARLLAYLEQSTATDSGDPDGYLLASRWERLAALETLEELRYVE